MRRKERSVATGQSPVHLLRKETVPMGFRGYMQHGAVSPSLKPSSHVITRYSVNLQFNFYWFNLNFDQILKIILFTDQILKN